MSECKHEYYQGSCEEYLRCRNCSDISEYDDAISFQAERIKGLNLDLGLARISMEHGQTLLASCEAALFSRDEYVAKLEADKKDLQAGLVEAMDSNSELKTMVKVFKSCIETKLMPGVDSPCHYKARELSED